FPSQKIGRCQRPVNPPHHHRCYRADKHVADPTRPPNFRHAIKLRKAELTADRGIHDSADCSTTGDKKNNLPQGHKKLPGSTLDGSTNALKQICVCSRLSSFEWRGQSNSCAIADLCAHHWIVL